MERWAHFLPCYHIKKPTQVVFLVLAICSLLTCVTVSLPVTSTVIFDSVAYYRQRKVLQAVCRQTTHFRCCCLAIVRPSFARGQGEEQEKCQQGWCRSADGADEVGLHAGTWKEQRGKARSLGASTCPKVRTVSPAAALAIC